MSPDWFFCRRSYRSSAGATLAVWANSEGQELCAVIRPAVAAYNRPQWAPVMSPSGEPTANLDSKAIGMYVLLVSAGG